MFPPGAIVTGTPGCRTAVARLIGHPPCGGDQYARVIPPCATAAAASSRTGCWGRDRCNVCDRHAGRRTAPRGGRAPGPCAPTARAPAKRRSRLPPLKCRSFSWRTSLRVAPTMPVTRRYERRAARDALDLRQEAASPITGSLTSGETQRAPASSPLAPVALPLHLEQNVGIGIGVAFLAAVDVVRARLRRVLRLVLA